MLLKKQQKKHDVIKKFIKKSPTINQKLINSTSFLQKLGTKLPNEIEKPTKTFDVSLKKVNILQPEYPFSINELKEAFFSKSQGHDEISFNVIKSCFGSLSKPLLHVFRLTLEE